MSVAKPRILYKQFATSFRKGSLSTLNTDINNNKFRYRALLRDSFQTIPSNLTTEQALTVGEEFLQMRNSIKNHSELLQKYWIGTHIPQRDRMERDANRVGLKLPKTYGEN